MRKIWIGLGFAAGYVLGAKAGRERYQQLKEQASRLAERPEVKQATRRVADTTIGKLQQSPRASAGLQRPAGSLRAFVIGDKLLQETQPRMRRLCRSRQCPQSTDHAGRADG
jgi:hypothetical protein